MTDTIYLDMDGVLCDFVTPALKLVGVDAKRSDVTDWDIPKALGIDHDVFWEPLLAAPANWWIRLPVYEWTNALLYAARRHTDEKALVTTPISPASAAGKWLWGRLHAPVFMFFTAQDKSFYAQPNSLLVDDCPANIDAWRAAGGKAILFPQSWNGNKLSIDDVLDAVRRGDDA